MTVAVASATPHEGIFNLEQALGAYFIERTEQIRMVLTAIVARQHTLIEGPPGTGKSMMLGAIGRGLGLTYWATQGDKFKKPESLFGPFSLRKLREQDVYEHNTDGSMATAQVVLLDEVYRFAGSTRDALLLALNERQFDNGTTRQSLPLMALFGGTNFVDDDEESAAFNDRFAVRMRVDRIDYTRNFQALLGLPEWADREFLTEAQLLSLQAEARHVPVPTGVIACLHGIARQLVSKGIDVSERRWIWSQSIMRAHAAVSGRKTVGDADLGVLRYTLGSGREQAREVATIVAHNVNPYGGKASELAEQAKEIHSRTIEAQTEDKMASMQAGIEGANKLKVIWNELTKLEAVAEKAGRACPEIAGRAAAVNDLRQNLRDAMMERE